MPQSPSDIGNNVFINCPFDPDYLPLLRAMVFAIRASGFTARCALEDDDSGELRILKILRIINECRFGIHDLSRTELNPVTQLPRFNMPFELGLDFALCHVSQGQLQSKNLLVLDREPFRYQSFISDLAGVDIKAHQNSPHKLIQIINDWLRTQSGSPDLPGAAAITKLFSRFEVQFPRFVSKRGHNPDELSFALLDLSTHGWLKDILGRSRR
jgi:hypothetical protein